MSDPRLSMVTYVLQIAMLADTTISVAGTWPGVRDLSVAVLVYLFSRAADTGLLAVRNIAKGFTISQW
jgi:hypothetical protein